MKTSTHIIFALSLGLASNAFSLPRWFHGKSRNDTKTPSATVVVDSGVSACKVDIDGDVAGVTDSKGILLIEGVDPGDHYLHVHCPGLREMTYFIEPTVGHKLQVKVSPIPAASEVAESSPLAAAVAETQLRRMVSQAVQLRASGQFDKAVELLRKASQLDQRNGDLHRELGITFLMFHDWESARVEMLEAIHLEPENVDAHSGLAYALEKLGDLEGALKQYQVCTHLDPADTTYRDHYVEVLGLVYAQKAQKKR